MDYATDERKVGKGCKKSEIRTVFMLSNFVKFHGILLARFSGRRRNVVIRLLSHLLHTLYDDNERNSEIKYTITINHDVSKRFWECV